MYDVCCRSFFSAGNKCGTVYKQCWRYSLLICQMTVKSGDETKIKEQLKIDMKSREQLPKEESSEVLAKYKISQMQILDSYSPMYEFED